MKNLHSITEKITKTVGLVAIVGALSLYGCDQTNDVLYTQNVMPVSVNKNYVQGRPLSVKYAQHAHATSPQLVVVLDVDGKRMLAEQRCLMTETVLCSAALIESEIVAKGDKGLVRLYGNYDSNKVFKILGVNVGEYSVKVTPAAD